jgi:disulfide bond formation protein DsbB
MGWALWLQYGQGLEPCPLCVFQRIAVSIIGVFFLIADPQSAALRRHGMRAVLVLICAGIGAAFAVRQV